MLSGVKKVLQKTLRFDAFKNKVDVTKLIDEQGNTTVTVKAKENVTMPELKLYRAIYKGNKLLGTLEEMKPNMVGGNSVFIFAPLTLKDGESSKIMLWDEKMQPTINAIINHKKRIEYIKMEITKDIKYVGVNDYDIELFEGQYAVQNGMAQLSSSKNLTFIQEEVHVKSAIDEQSRAQLEALAKALVVD